MESRQEHLKTEIRFSPFLYATIVANIFFAVPAISGIWLFNLLELKAVLIILACPGMLLIPVSAALAWLIAKGSNWVNTAAAIMAACSVQGRIYGVLFGGMFGFKFFGIAGGIIFAVISYLIAYALSIPLGKYLASRVLSRQ